MGKDATNNFFAENQTVEEQRDNSGLKGEPFKGEQFNSSDSRQFKDDQFKESSKGDFNAFQDHRLHEGAHHREQPLDMGISRELQGSGPELREPSGGLHGDKWQAVQDGGQFKGASCAAQVMDAPSAGGMHGDKLLDQQSHLFKGETILRPQGEQSSLPPTSTFKALEGAPLMEDHFKTAEFKSQSQLADLPSAHANFHDGRFREGEPALHEHQILQPALHASKLEDNTMRDATIHGGRSRPLIPESNPLDQLPLAERVVAGVHAGDPLSSATLKPSSVDKLKTKKDKKFKKDKKLEQSAFGQDAHLKRDDALIPHEHLKKDQSMISEQHLAGVPVLERQERFDERLADAPIILKKDEPMSSAPLTETFIAAGENFIVKEEGTLKQTSLKKDKKKDKKLKKDKHFTKDAHLNTDMNIVDSSFNRDVNFHDGRDSAFQKDSQLLKDSEFKDAHLSRDARFTKDLNKTSFAPSQDFHKDSLVRDARLSSQDAFLVTEDQSKADAGKKGSKLKDKLYSKKEKLKAKLGMKKDNDLALADAHSETHAPKGHEIATIKIPGIESGDRAAQEMVNHQAKAKKELNAELKEHAGHSDHLAPSEITHHLHPHENRALDSQPPLMSNNLNADQITRDQIQAKSDLNAEIRGHSGEFSSAGLLPSQHFPQDQFAKDSQFLKDNQFEKDSQFSRNSNQFQARDQQFFNKPSDMLEKDIVLAKNDVNAEIKKAGHGFFGTTDHIQPSDVAHKPGFTETIKEKAFDLKEQFQPMPAATLESRQLEAERLAGGNDDALTKKTMLAKKALNAEISKSGSGFFGATDHILPSNIAHRKPGFAANIKEKAIALKDQFQPMSAATLESRHLEAQRLAGFSESSDAWTKKTMLAKKALNAEINKAAGYGFFGATDHILPSEVARRKSGFAATFKEKAIALKDQFQPMPAATLESKQLEAQRLAGMAETDDLVMKEHMMAKKDVNAEIAKAGHSIFGAADSIHPSDVAQKHIAKDTKHLEGEQLAGLSGFEDRSSILAKKDVNAEINKAGHGIFGATDHIQPSDVAPKPGFTDMIKNAALAVKDQFFQSAPKTETRQLEAERLAGLSEVDDSLMKDNMLAKKGVNAEIKAAAGPAIFGAKDHITPSKVSAGYPHREVKHFEGEQLAGLSGTEDLHSIQLKKEVNAEIFKAGHGFFGAKDHILPSKVSSGYPHRDVKHFEGEQLAHLSGTEDSQCLMAKKDVNAEIKKAAGHGLFGATDHIQPSAVAPKHLEGEQLAELSGLEDTQSIQAKKSVNAEIMKAGHGFFGTHDIHPSDIAHKHASKKLEGEQLAGLKAADDLLMQDNMLAKKDVNAEIKKTSGHGIFGAPDHILPSDVGKPTLAETISEKAANAAILAKDKANIAAVAVKDKANIAAAVAMDQANIASVAKDKAFAAKDQAIAVKEQYKPSAATIDSRYLEAQRLDGFSADDLLMKESVLAKKEVNAEINRLAGTGLFAAGYIMPSKVIHSQEGFGKRIKDKAMSAATAMKGQFESKAPLEGEKLAGISETKDSLVKDNVLAKKEVNAEIKAFGSDNIHPSEIAPASGVTVIHDGRSEHIGSDRLKSEMEYEQAQGTAIQGHHLPSVSAMIKGTVATAASVAMAAASAVKGQFQAATASREVSEEDFPGEFQKADFEKELNVGGLKESDMDDDMMKDSILAKKDVNAEIKEHAPTVGDIIHPSEIAHHSDIAHPSDIADHHSTDAAHPSMTEMIKERVASAATTMKETLQNLH